jgi:hypothetical protein
VWINFPPSNYFFLPKFLIEVKCVVGSIVHIVVATIDNIIAGRMVLLKQPKFSEVIIRIICT